MSLRIAEHAERSDTGRVRSANEDSFLARPPLFVVADGMGGANAGEVASRTAIDGFAGGLPAGSGPSDRLVEAVLAANSAIHRDAGSNESRRGMGTTVTAALVGDGSVDIAHVGDSRAYLIRGGSIERLTRDHTLVDELVRQGRLTEEEAATHPQRSIITRALGPEPDVEVDSTSHQLEEGDVLLLCSDGLTGMVPDPVLLSTVEESRNLSVAARSLVRKANEAGGRDNITVVLVRMAAAVPGLPQTRPVSSRGSTGGAAAARRRVPRSAKLAGAAAALVLAVLLAGSWQASRGVFFLGVDDSGVVAVYRGVPFELPFGIDLYERWYASGVPVSTVDPARRATLLDHSLRSRTDAADLVASLERGDLRQ